MLGKLEKKLNIATQAQRNSEAMESVGDDYSMSVDLGLPANKQS